MSKAELRALEAYPPKYAKQERHPKRIQSEKVDTHQPMRTIYIKGYKQAEKDLELTWKDMKLIWNITDEMDNMPEEEFYQEVLKRFKEIKDQ